MAESTAAEKRIYEASDGHKTVLALAFLVLLPFMVSMPILFLKRSFHGLWTDALSAAVFGLLFTAWMIFLFIEVMTAMRTRIAFGENTLNLRIPNWRGPNPGVKFVKRRVPYEEIVGVETRSEIYKSAQLPVLTRATSILLKDGERIVLGYQNEHEEDPDIDFERIARQIAKRVGVDVRDRGCITAGSQIATFASGSGPDWEREPLSESAYKRLRSRNRWAMVALITAIVVMFGVGFVYDLLRAGILANI
ncbi:MAG: hypothetical protein GC150_10505 [Rhizobiales bacterium]|nr:hypothetical protein [Hyphomicrobiales bacterium]